MDETKLKLKLKELRDRYKFASFQWIYKKALEELQPESQPDSQQMSKFSSFSDHVAHFEQVRKAEGEPVYRVQGGFDIPLT